MPIQLTAAFDPGDVDPGVTYPRVIIKSFLCQPLTQEIAVVCEYGSGSSSSWTPGVVPTQEFLVSGSDYTTMIAELPDSGLEAIYDGAARVIYQWLIDEGHFAGTIV